MNALHAPTLLAPLVQQFFTERLIAQRNMSPRTVAAYRDTFRLLLVWFEQKLHKAPSRLALTDPDVTRISAFLDYLEIERHNTIRSRNARFAALRSFLNFATRKEPAALGTIQGVLAVPMKRFERPLLGYLTREEIEAVLDAPEGNTWCGQRDRVMLMMLYNTGARVSERIRLTPGSVVLEGTACVHLHGKGRKERTVPLWRTTAALLRQWLRHHPRAADQPLFPNRVGGPMTRTGVTDRLQLAVTKAAKRYPELTKRHISTQHCHASATGWCGLDSHCPVARSREHCNHSHVCGGRSRYEGVGAQCRASATYQIKALSSHRGYPRVPRRPLNRKIMHG